MILTFDFVAYKNINGCGMTLPPLPSIPPTAYCGWGCSAVPNPVSLFATMALLNNVSNNTFPIFNNTSVPQARVLDNNKSNFSLTNIFSNVSSTPMFFMPVFPPLPKLDFKFVKPSNIFSFFNTNKRTTKRYPSLTLSPARTVEPKQTTSLSEVAKIYNPQKGIKLANEAIAGLKTAQSGYCARAVKTAICDAGLGSYQSGHAYQCPDILSRNPNFKEVKVKGSDLEKLPAGCILAYNRGDAGYSQDYGHIEIKGQGNQAIHFTVNNNIKESDNVRVFVPV